MKVTKRPFFISLVAGVLLLGIACSPVRWELVSFCRRVPLLNRFFRVTVDGQVERYGAQARARLIPQFENKGAKYPPDRVAFIAIKDTKKLYV